MLQKPPYQVRASSSRDTRRLPLPCCISGDHHALYGLLLQDDLKPEGIDKDVWLHQKMKNTKYLLEYDLSEFEDIGAIGLELWQVTVLFVCFGFF